MWSLKTPIGWLEGVDDGKALLSLSFCDQKPKSSRVVKDNIFGEALKNYFEKGVPLKGVDVSLEGLPDFTRKVLKRCYLIPLGKTLSYGELAEKCGSPKGARAVGQVMRNNPLPLVIPCHRVLSQDNFIGGFNGGLDRKKWLLAHEKIVYNL
jgi:methylated-DNA-[protein]-cysteine S-methyltransferase